MNYRREIDGLRAVAVVSVVLFHAGFEVVSGGFIGVDIFFVISGYLITSIILKERIEGEFQLIRFYERRVRRILPALFTVLLACIPFAYLWITPEELKEFSRSLEFVSIFVSNVFFYRTIDYFNAQSELKPLLHTWSLGVEEQYYALFPLLLMALWKRGRNWTYAGLALLAAGSLIAAHWASSHHPLASFYLLPTRVWELLAGAMTGIWLLFNRDRLPGKPMREGLSALGLVLIAYGLFGFDRTTVNPGLVTLIPVLGVCLVILTASPEQWAGKLLGSRLFVGLGLISYSTYLWHQPVFVFLRLRSVDKPGLGAVAGALALTFFLATLTWKFVETPVRKPGRFSRGRVFGGALAGILFFVALGSIGEAKNGFETRYSMPPSIAEEFVPYRFTMNCPLPDKCGVGDAAGEDSGTVVFGDSHAMALLPAFETLGKSARRYVSFVGTNGCPPLLGVTVLKGTLEPGLCEKTWRRQLAFVEKHRPKKVILAGRWAVYTVGDYEGTGIYYLGFDDQDATTGQRSREVFEEGLRRTIDTYRSLGAEVYVVAQVPQQRANTKDVYYALYQKGSSEGRGMALIKRYSVTAGEHEKLQAYNRAVLSSVAAKGLIGIVNLDSLFCDASICAMGTPDRPYYQDKDHLSHFGANYVAPKFAAFLRACEKIKSVARASPNPTGKARNEKNSGA